MNKTIKMSLLVVFILIIVCTVIVVWHPWHSGSDDSGSSSALSSVEASSESPSSAPESSLDLTSSEPESSPAQESSEVSELASGLIPEDQPDSPDLNFETSGSSYDDIMVNVLTCLMSRDMAGLSSYVGSRGLQLSPTGAAVNDDVVLSADQTADFFSRGETTYGTFPGSGESIALSPEAYYERFLCPSDLNFSAATVSYNDSADLTAAAAAASDPKTVAYYYAPSVMEWKRIILVFDADGASDVLRAIIYQDATTD